MLRCWGFLLEFLGSCGPVQKIRQTGPKDRKVPHLLKAGNETRSAEGAWAHDKHESKRPVQEDKGVDCEREEVASAASVPQLTSGPGRPIRNLLKWWELRTALPDWFQVQRFAL